MKKILILSSAAVLVIALIVGIVIAVRINTDDSSECNVHNDSDGDGYCDICNEKTNKNTPSNNENASPGDVESNSPGTDIFPCEKCIDNDDDGSCDACKTAIEKVPEPCTECTDSNYDLICDACGNEIVAEDLPCTECSDSDSDGTCDVCGKPTPPQKPQYISVLISENDISGYTVAYDPSDEANALLASEISAIIAEKTGTSLPILDADELQSGNYILVRSEKTKSGNEGFYVTVTSDKNLEIISEFPNKTIEAGRKYLASVFETTEKVISMTEARINVRDVSYADFGAIGDGESDDFDSIKQAHLYANQYGHTVTAEAGAVYYIASIPSTINISTDVCWNYATFIIDNRSYSSASSALPESLFTVTADHIPLTLDEEDDRIQSINANGGIPSSTEKIYLALGYPAMLTVENSIGQKQIFLIDKDGNVDPSTPILTEFGNIAKMKVIRTDEAPITLQKGKFTTLVAKDAGSAPLSANILINRSNTRIYDIAYMINDEDPDTVASPYKAFIEISDCCNVSVSNYSFDAHRSEGLQRSYAISLSFSINASFTNCSQANFYKADGSTVNSNSQGCFFAEYSRNFLLSACRISVFSARTEIYGATVKDYSVFSLIDSDSVTLENVFILP